MLAQKNASQNLRTKEKQKREVRDSKVISHIDEVLTAVQNMSP
jgi:hypothetical protein